MCEFFVWIHINEYYYILNVSLNINEIYENYKIKHYIMNISKKSTKHIKYFKYAKKIAKLNFIFGIPGS